MREADWFTSTEALAAVNPSRLVCKENDVDVTGQTGWELPLPVPNFPHRVLSTHCSLLCEQVCCVVLLGTKAVPKQECDTPTSGDKLEPRVACKLLPVYRGVTAFVLEPLSLSGVKWSVKSEGFFFSYFKNNLSYFIGSPE